jgi:hypothetical protein
MKKVMMVAIAIMIAGIVAGSIFYACKKDGTTPFHKNSNNMRVFNSIEELLTEVDLVNSMNEEQLRSHEEEVGFLSFGRASDEVYHPIIAPIEEAEMEFSVEQASAYVAQYPQYLELVTDDNNEHVFITKYHSSHFRYVMNEDRVFKIEDKCYRVFQKTVLGSSNIEQLLSISEEEIPTILKSFEGKDDNNFEGSNGLFLLYKENFNIVPVQKASPKAYCSSQCTNCYSFTHESPVASNNKEKVVGNFSCVWYSNSGVRADGKIYALWRGCGGCVWVACQRTYHWNINTTIFRHPSYVYGPFNRNISTSFPTYSTVPVYADLPAYTNGGTPSIYKICGSFRIATTTCNL